MTVDHAGRFDQTRTFFDKTFELAETVCAELTGGFRALNRTFSGRRWTQCSFRGWMVARPDRDGLNISTDV